MAPAAEAVIRLGSEGGAATAREINQTAGAMSELGEAVGGMTSEFSRQPDMSGWSGVGKAMTVAATETSKFSGGMVGLSKSLDDARTELGGFGFALGLVPGLGLVEMAVGTWTRREEELTRSLAEKNKELKSTIDLIEAAERSGLDLTESQKNLAKHTRFVAKEVDQQTLKQAKANVERLKATKVEDTWAFKLSEAAARLGLTTRAAEMQEKAINKLRRETLQAVDDLDALNKSGVTGEERIKKHTAAMESQTRAMQGIRKERRLAREALEVVDPLKRSAMEIKGIEQIKHEQLELVKLSTRRRDLEVENVERVRQSRLVAMSKSVADEQEYADGLELINATAADKAAMAWELHAQRVATVNKAATAKVKAHWAEAVSIMTPMVEGFATTLVQGFKSGTDSAADAFKNLGDAVVAQVIRMIAKQLVLNALTGGMGGGLLGGAGKLLGFQHGGMIPAPRGQAVNITAHGGERVVSDTGRGAPMGGGGGSTGNNYYFQTGVLTPDSQRTMIRQISRTQKGTGEKSFPQ